MFTQPVSSPPPGPTSTSANPVTPSRPSRLRGLSYLRNYTHSHLLSRDTHNSSVSGSTSPGQQTANLTRSVSYSPTTASAPNNISTNSTSNLSNNSSNSTHSNNANTTANINNNRLTLVQSVPDNSQARTPQRNTAPSNSPPLPIPVSDASSAPAHALDSATGDTADMTQSTPEPTVDGVASPPDTVPSIRFSAYYDPRSTRPSLSFPPISRTLPGGSDIIRVGRYSERDSQSAAHMAGNQPSSAPVGFKSKVVSRRHCEFWYEDGKWFIKDVKSSSGTFLNHIRLSPPSQESKAFPVNDGDIIQLGIDFKGGEEMIFRCVKMRLELNRGWQNKLNTFNVAAHKRLRTMATNGGTSVSSSSSQDCSICLNSIAPCQSLFVAPCSHTWHFKCVRSLLMSPQYPIFICPNCRAGADLEADVDEPTEEWQKLEETSEEAEAEMASNVQSLAPAETASEPADTTIQDVDAMDVTVSINNPSTPAAERSERPHSTTEPVPIRNPASGAGRVGHLRGNGTPSPPGSGREGPITPRNDAGPWVFDGSAGRRRAADGESGMRSLDAAAEMDLSENVASDDSSR